MRTASPVVSNVAAPGTQPPLRVDHRRAPTRAVEHQLAQQPSVRLAQLAPPPPLALPPRLLFRSVRLGLPAVLDRLAAVAELLQQQYWINDPWQYRLPYAPPGYRWIRYWDDAMLVDTWTGEVVDVIHNFFW